VFHNDLDQEPCGQVELIVPGWLAVTLYGADNGITIVTLGNLSVIEQERLVREILKVIIA
jgi:hypothetical protein